VKAFLGATLATAALLVAAPSFAQSSANDAVRQFRNLLGQPSDSGDRDLNDQERRLTDLIEQNSNEGRIDRREADRAFEELRSIRRQEDDLRARDGGRLTPSDHDLVRDRLAGLDRDVDRMREAGGPPRVDRDRGEFWRDAPENLDQREDWLEQRIRRGMEDGSLDRGEARTAMDQLRSIRRSESAYMRRDHGRLNDAHETELQQRLDDLGRQLRWMRHD